MARSPIFSVDRKVQKAMKEMAFKKKPWSRSCAEGWIEIHVPQRNNSVKHNRDKVHEASVAWSWFLWGDGYVDGFSLCRYFKGQTFLGISGQMCLFCVLVYSANKSRGCMYSTKSSLSFFRVFCVRRDHGTKAITDWSGYGSMWTPWPGKVLRMFRHRGRWSNYQKWRRSDAKKIILATWTVSWQTTRVHDITCVDRQH